MFAVDDCDCDDDRVLVELVELKEMDEVEEEVDPNVVMLDLFRLKISL